MVIGGLSIVLEVVIAIGFVVRICGLVILFVVVCAFVVVLPYAFVWG